MDIGISGSVGLAANTLIGSTMKALGIDEKSREQKSMIERHINVSLSEAMNVQFIGMSVPVPLSEIYLPTRYSEAAGIEDGSTAENHEYNLDDIQNTNSRIIFAPPGFGKTTYSHWLYLKLLDDKIKLPILITLRWPNAVENLQFFVAAVEKRKFQMSGNKHIVLIVDGYDEVDVESRKLVSEQLRAVSALDNASFILSCRTHYEIIDLKAQQLTISGFTSSDANAFCENYFRIAGIEVDVPSFVKELHEKGFKDYLESPLMLSLVCVLRTSTFSDLPKSTIGLLRRSLELITLRWDEFKGIHRERSISLDGEERIRVLMEVAFKSEKFIISDSLVHNVVRGCLQRAQFTSASTTQFLDEIAQHFGLLVASTSGDWVFSHRAIHDFLAARYCVESGQGLPNGYGIRYAYCACLLSDATHAINKSLRSSNDLLVLRECVANRAFFDVTSVAKNLAKYFGRVHKDEIWSVEYRGGTLTGTINQSLFGAFSDEFIFAIENVGHRFNKPEEQFLYAASFYEINRRGLARKLPTIKDVSNVVFKVGRILNDT